MQWCNLFGETIRRARRAVHPLPASWLPAPEVFPRPGHKPGDFDCDPSLAHNRRKSPARANPRLRHR